jgi:hypothetical protein
MQMKLVAQHLSEEAIIASVKNWKTVDALGASDMRSVSEDNGDDSSEVMVPELNKVLRNVNEVVTLLEQRTNTEHLQLLHVVNIKQCVLRKCSYWCEQTASSPLSWVSVVLFCL